eukprot:3005184-Prymnesium_polylepis.1
MHTNATVDLAGAASADEADGPSEAATSLATCTHWATIDRLPPSVIFNPYELRRLHRLNRLSGVRDALTTRTTELEQPAEESRRGIRAASHPNPRGSCRPPLSPRGPELPGFRLPRNPCNSSRRRISGAHRRCAGPPSCWRMARWRARSSACR